MTGNFPEVYMATFLRKTNLIDFEAFDRATRIDLAESIGKTSRKHTLRCMLVVQTL